MKQITLSRGTQVDTEKCVDKVGSRFGLVVAAAARAREIRRLNKHSKKREHIFSEVTALLEIQEGKIDVGGIFERYGTGRR